MSKTIFACFIRARICVRASCCEQEVRWELNDTSLVRWSPTYSEAAVDSYSASYRSQCFCNVNDSLHLNWTSYNFHIAEARPMLVLLTRKRAAKQHSASEQSKKQVSSEKVGIADLPTYKPPAGLLLLIRILKQGPIKPLFLCPRSIHKKQPDLYTRRPTNRDPSQTSFAQFQEVTLSRCNDSRHPFIWRWSADVTDLVILED